MEKVYICNNANSIVERLRCLLSSMEPKEANDNPGSVVTRQNRSPERGNKNAPWPAFGDASTTSVLPSAERCAAAAGLAKQAPTTTSSSNSGGKAAPERAITPGGLAL